MKKLSTLFCLLFLSLSIMAQVQITAQLDTDTNFDGLDLTDNTIDLQVYINIENTGTETAELKWEVSNVEALCSANWDWLICDNNTCYTTGVTTNVDPSGTGINNPSVVEVGENYNFIIHVQPGAKAGCCEMLVNFYSIIDDKEVIATIQVPIKINDPQCAIISGLSDLEETTKVNIYPNPSAGLVNWTSNEQIDKIVVSDLLGARLEQHKLANKSFLDLAHLRSGYYNLTLLNNEKGVLRSVPFLKL